MKAKFCTAVVIFVCLLFSCSDNSIIQSVNDHDRTLWPGKDGVVKCNIEFPSQFVLQYNLTLAAGAKGTSFFFKIPLDENDVLKKGRIQVDVYASIEEAQLALMAYLETMTTNFKPPRLSDKQFNAGDIAFGEETSGIYKVAFVRNNVLVIVHAPKEIAEILAKGIDEKIQSAPDWKIGSSKPSFIGIE